MKNKIYITLLTAAVLLQGCLNDELDGQLSPDSQNDTQIQLAMSDPQIIDTRTVESNERTIDDAYVLVFTSTDTYRTGKKITAPITNNGTATPKINTAISGLNVGQKIVVLCNTGVSTLPAIPKGTSINDINNYFMSGSWDINQAGTASGRKMPMSGIVTWTGTDPTVPMYRSVAKIQLKFNIPTGFDMTGTFVANSTSTWGLYNAPKDGNIYSTETTMNVPMTSGFEDDTSLPKRIVGDVLASDVQLTRYTPEYPSATLAKGTAVSASTWNKDRTCLILHTAAGYYRIDIAKGTTYTETKQFLDINRNSHYTITIVRVDSYGYSTIAEALRNPASNLEYEVVDNSDENSFTTSNGQYAIQTDKMSFAVNENVVHAINLVKFKCLTNGFPNSEIETRTIRLVGADKSTAIPVSQLQMCKSDGTPIAGNTTTYTAADDLGYQLKYTSPTSIPSGAMYVEICYGNIRHYVNISVSPTYSYTFNVVGPSDFSYGGGSKDFNVTSYKIVGGNIVPVQWTATEYSEDGGLTWTTRPTNFVAASAENGPGNELSVEAIPYPITLSKQTGLHPHDDILKATPAVSGRYNLSNSTGAAAVQNTANCYVVNAPGDYSIPLVYGNAIKNGAPNPSAYTSSRARVYAPGNRVLTPFQNTLSKSLYDSPITDPYIYNNAYVVMRSDAARIDWTDAQYLVTNVKVSDDMKSINFTVPAAYIKQGNAIISLKNGQTTGTGSSTPYVLWNWHIWVTDYKLSETRSVTNHEGVNYKFMPYDIGYCDGIEYPARSLKIRFTQQESGLTKVIDINQLAGYELGNSPVFQYGYKSPHTAGVSATDNVTVEKDRYKSGILLITASYPAESFANAYEADTISGKINVGFYQLYSSFNTNMRGERTYMNLWSADNVREDGLNNDDPVVKTVYDPSPVGFHVPPSNAFSGLTVDGQDKTDGTETGIYGTYDPFHMRYRYERPGNDPLDFYLVGCRGLYNGGSVSLDYRKEITCWGTANPFNLEKTKALYIQLNDAGKLMVIPQSGTPYRTVGTPIRPVAD